MCNELNYSPLICAKISMIQVHTINLIPKDILSEHFILLNKCNVCNSIFYGQIEQILCYTYIFKILNL